MPAPSFFPLSLITVLNTCLAINGAAFASQAPASQPAVAPEQEVLAAIDNLDAKSLEALLQRGMSPNAKEKQESPLCAAVNRISKDNDLEILNLLLKHGADPNSISQFGCSAIALATHHKHHSIVKILLDKGATANPRFGPSPLLMATTVEAVDIIPLLIEAGAEVNCSDGQGNTALHVAARRGNMLIVQLLLKCGADATRKNDYGHTPLWEAIHKGNSEIEKVLLQSTPTSKPAR